MTLIMETVEIGMRLKVGANFKHAVHYMPKDVAIRPNVKSEVWQVVRVESGDFGVRLELESDPSIYIRFSVAEVLSEFELVRGNV